MYNLLGFNEGLLYRYLKKASSKNSLYYQFTEKSDLFISNRTFGIIINKNTEFYNKVLEFVDKDKLEVFEQFNFLKDIDKDMKSNKNQIERTRILIDKCNIYRMFSTQKKDLFINEEVLNIFDYTITTYYEKNNIIYINCNGTTLGYICSVALEEKEYSFIKKEPIIV